MESALASGLLFAIGLGVWYVAGLLQQWYRKQGGTGTLVVAGAMTIVAFAMLLPGVIRALAWVVRVAIAAYRIAPT